MSSATWNSEYAVVVVPGGPFGWALCCGNAMRIHIGSHSELAMVVDGHLKCMDPLPKHTVPVVDFSIPQRLLTAPVGR